MSSSRALSRRLSRPIFVATIVALFTMVTVGSAEASIVDDLRAILQRAQQVAGQQPAPPPAPPVTGGIAGQIGPATGTTPPPSQIGYIYFSNTTSDGSGTEAQQRAFPSWAAITAPYPSDREPPPTTTTCCRRSAARTTRSATWA